MLGSDIMKFEDESVLQDILKESNKFWETYRYVSKCKYNNELKDCLKNFRLRSKISWRTLICILFNGLIIATEIKNARFEVFKKAYYGYSVNLDKHELICIINDGANRWLEMDHSKIKLFKDYCDKLIGNEKVCKQVVDNAVDCKGKSEIAKRDNYHKKRQEIYDLLDELIDEQYAEYRKNERRRLEIERGRYLPPVINKEDGAARTQKYEENLLKKEDGEKNG